LTWAVFFDAEEVEVDFDFPAGELAEAREA
jgi:hypothetical protein